jgi:hypothetical protein
MDLTKIRLSEEEIQLACNANWILTKNEILNKATLLLSSLQQKQQGHINSLKKPFSPELLHTSPKISKGENYLGLPYRILDYPAVFSKKDICAVRTMFWWGDFFSTTFHLSGSYKIKYKEKIADFFSHLARADFFICINEDEWQHHFAETNYLSIKNLGKKDFEEILFRKKFIKLSSKTAVDNWNTADEILMKQFKLITEILAD